jgi:hypothetical protein
VNRSHEFAMSSPSEVNLTALAINYETLKQSTDGTFLIALGIIIFLMQVSFMCDKT